MADLFLVVGKISKSKVAQIFREFKIEYKYSNLEVVHVSEQQFLREEGDKLLSHDYFKKITNGKKSLEDIRSYILTKACYDNECLRMDTLVKILGIERFYVLHPNGTVEIM